MGIYHDLVQTEGIFIVSLPKNDPELARAAFRGGADGVKVHLNVHHRASGHDFGALAQERAGIKAVLEVAAEGGKSRPVGVVPGSDDKFCSVNEMQELMKMGVSFCDMFDFHMPAEYLDLKSQGLDFMMAFHHGFNPVTIAPAKTLGVSAIEASIVDPMKYGKTLTFQDLATYHYLAQTTGLPILVPTQKKIVVGDIVGLKRSGVSGMVLGVIVTGTTADSLERCCRALTTAWRK